MRVPLILVLILASGWPRAAAAQIRQPAANTVAIGGDVGILAPDNEENNGATTLQSVTGNFDAFVEYYHTDRASLRGMYGWAAPQFESTPERTLQRHQLTLNFIYNWQLGRFRPFATVGGGAYFLSRREGGEVVGRAVTKPGGILGWGGEFYLRTFAVKSEMNVHILGEEKEFPELNGRTLTAFTWTFGIKVPF